MKAFQRALRLELDEDAVKHGAALVGARDRFGRNALHLCALDGAVRVAEALFQLPGSGARWARRVDDADSAGYTPIMYAAASGCTEMVRLLRARGARWQNPRVLRLAAAGGGEETTREVLNLPKKDPSSLTAKHGWFDVDKGAWNLLCTGNSADDDVFDFAATEEEREVLRPLYEEQRGRRDEIERRERETAENEVRLHVEAVGNAEKHVTEANRLLLTGDVWSAARRFELASDAVPENTNWRVAAKNARLEEHLHLAGTIVGFTDEDVDAKKPRDVHVWLTHDDRIEISYSVTVGYVLRQRKYVRRHYRFSKRWRMEVTPYRVVLYVPNSGVDAASGVFDASMVHNELGKGDTTITLHFPDPRRTAQHDRRKVPLFTSANKREMTERIARLRTRVVNRLQGQLAQAKKRG